MAVGVTVERKKFKEFAETIEKKAKEEHTENIVPVISIDREIYPKDLTLKTIEDLMLLEPHGTSNPMPIFLIRNLKIDSIRTLVEGKHLKLTLQDSGNIINAIGFGLGHYAEEFMLGDRIDVIGTVELNVFNNIKNVQINMKDIRKSY